MVGLGSDGTNANKRVALKWRLFKHYAQILGQQAFCYKWPRGTRWVSHQVTALDVHLKNLRVMLAFSNEQAEVPYNTTICKEMTRIEGIGREASDLKLLLYQALRRDIMAYTGPCPLILEKITLVMPEAVTAIERAIRTLSIILTHLSFSIQFQIITHMKDSSFTATTKLKCHETLYFEWTSKLKCCKIFLL